MAYSTGASSTCSNGYGGDLPKRGPCGEDHLCEWPKNKLSKAKKGKFPQRLCAVRKIGKGGFGEVYLGHRCVLLPDDLEEKCFVAEPWAIKVLESKGFVTGSPVSDASSVSAKEDRIKREMDVHNMLKDNPYVVTPKTTMSLAYPNRKTFLLAMEYCKFGDLNQFLHEQVGGRLINETLAREVTEQVALGLKALKEKSYFHRDVKASNIFVTEHEGQPKFKIGDFGLVATINEQNRIECGTLSAMAPEMDGRNLYGPEVDIWSLGILLFSLLVGYHPFYLQGNSHEDARRNARSDPLCFPHGKISPAAKDLLTKMLCKDPRQRISLDEVLRHPFIAPKNYQENTQSDSGFLTTSHLSTATSNTTYNKSRAPILQPLLEKSETYKTYGQYRKQRPINNGVQQLINQPLRPPSKMALHMTSSAPSLSHIEPVVQYHGSAMPSSCQSRITSLNPPLSTTRLRPSSKVHKFKGGNIIIRPDSCVDLEFSKTKEVIQNGMVTSVSTCEFFTISPNGQTIEVRKGASKDAILKSYSYAELPTKYWSKYNFAAKFVAIIKEQTPKITLYTDKVVCRLMENEPEPNCEVCFYGNGPRFSFSPSKGVRITSLSKVEHFSAQTLSLDSSHELAYHWRVFRETHERVLKLEKLNRESEFPITFGKRPSSLSGF